MPGSPGNPVILDPFRTIIEVGWNPATHLAVQLRYTTTTWYHFLSEFCDPPDYPGGGAPPNSHEYLEQVAFEAEGAPTGGYARRGEEWVAIDDIDEVTGIPAAGAGGTYAAWQYVSMRRTGGSGDDPVFVSGSGQDLHFRIDDAKAGSFTPDAGSGTGILMPGGVGEFTSGFTPEFAVIAQNFQSADPVCLVGVGFPPLQNTSRLYDVGIVRVGSFAVPVSSIHAIWRGRGYTGMAAYVPTVTSTAWEPWSGSLETGTGSLYVLCARDE